MKVINSEDQLSLHTANINTSIKLLKSHIKVGEACSAGADLLIENIIEKYEWVLGGLSKDSQIPLATIATLDSQCGLIILNSRDGVKKLFRVISLINSQNQQLRLLVNEQINFFMRAIPTESWVVVSGIITKLDFVSIDQKGLESTTDGRPVGKFNIGKCKTESQISIHLRNVTSTLDMLIPVLFGSTANVRLPRNYLDSYWIVDINMC